LAKRCAPRTRQLTALIVKLRLSRPDVSGNDAVPAREHALPAPELLNGQFRTGHRAPRRWNGPRFTPETPHKR
jgi:hypothetical protein